MHILVKTGFSFVSPIQVLIRPDPAWFPSSDEIGCVQGGMAVDVLALFLIVSMMEVRFKSS